MTIFGSRKITFYKKLHLIYPLIKALSSENKWERYHAVKALGEIGNRKVLPGLRAMLEENKPGWWVEDVEKTLNDLAPHYPGREDILDAIESYNLRWDRTLRTSAEMVITQIEAKYSRHS